MNNYAETIVLHPPESELGQTADGLWYMKDEAIKSNLDTLFLGWDTTYYKLDIEETPKRIAVATCTLIVRTEKETITRKGSITLQLGNFPEWVDVANYALINCIADAARSLGNRFGRSLNNGIKVLIPFDSLYYHKKEKPSNMIVAKWKLANAGGDVKTVIELEQQFDFS